MIVSTATAHSVRHGPGQPLGRRCLARRGMLHSECEAVDHVRLPAGGAVEDTGRGGADEAWLVLSGAVVVEEQGGDPWRLDEGALLLSPAAARTRVTALPGGAELLVVAVLPQDRISLLPARVPEQAHD